MRIDAYQIFASGCSESRILEASEANIHQVFSLDVLLSISSKKNDLEISVCLKSALNEEQNSYEKEANELIERSTKNRLTQTDSTAK